MPWCPKCQTEYREGYSICADCQVALVDKLPKLPPVDLGEPVLLITLNDVFEGNILLELLRENKIPAFQKGRGVGGYLNIIMSVNSFGTEIYVPRQMLKQAQELMEILYPTQGINELPVLDEDSLDDY